jgi:hypothetical protein
MAYLGDFATGKPVYALFTTVKATGSPAALVSGAARTIKNGLASGLHATGVTLTQSAGSITGLNKVVVLTSGTLYGSGNYDIILSTGSADGKNLRGYLIGSFSIKARFPNRTLVTGQHDAIGTRAWAATTRVLTSGAAVWAAGTKVLTSGGVVWTAGARTLTSGGVAWTAAARTLTSGAILTTAKLTEQASPPTASGPTVGSAIMWNFQAIRNKRVTTATTDKMHGSTGGVVGTATLVFATAGTFTKGKYA